MVDYKKTHAEFSFQMPDTYNFGFDQIDKLANDKHKIAFYEVSTTDGQVTPHTFTQLRDRSNKFANALVAAGCNLGDKAFIMIPRVPAWYDVMIGCCKAAIVAMPGTNLLTAKDIAYRVNKAGARIAIVSADGAAKVDEIRKNCPTLEVLIVVGAERKDWLTFESMCESSSESLVAADAPVTRSDDLMLIYFTSGTTAMPKMVPRNHGYALYPIPAGQKLLGGYSTAHGNKVQRKYFTTVQVLMQSSI